MPYLEPDTGPIVLNDVHCNSTEATLLDCQHVNLTEFPQQNNVMHNCTSGVGAGVTCPFYDLLKNVRVTFMNSSHCPLHDVWISWELNSTVIYQPSSFNININCHSNHELIHKNLIIFVVNNKTFTVQLGCLPTYYICCVRAVYGSDNNVIDESCIPLQLPNKTTNTESDDFVSAHDASRGLDNTAGIVGGALALIIIVLLIVLAICGGALFLLLRSRSLILRRYVCID